jgi:hypothetical protein
VIWDEAEEMEPMKGRGQDQKEKWGMRKERVFGFLEGMRGSAAREYWRAVPGGRYQLIISFWGYFLLSRESKESFGS